MAIRMFIALDLDESIRQRLTQAAREFPEGNSKIRWVPPENLHVTVKFLGNVAKARARNVCELMPKVAEGIEPFDFEVVGLRCVPPGGRVKMIWADIHEPTGRLAAAAGLVETAMTSLRFPREKRQFVPHITVGRVKMTEDSPGLRAAAAQHAETHFGRQDARELVTYSSKLIPNGAVYTAVLRSPLGPA